MKGKPTLLHIFSGVVAYRAYREKLSNTEGMGKLQIIPFPIVMILHGKGGIISYIEIPKFTLTLKVPEKLQLYGLYVYHVVHICDFGMLRVNARKINFRAPSCVGN